MAMRQRAVLGDEVTYVVLDRDWQVVEPAEQYLEHLRQEQYSPNTVRAYAQVKGGTMQTRGKYASFLGHLGGGQSRRVIGRRRDPKTPPPFLTPAQITVIKDDAARFGRNEDRWSGDLRLRLFWTLLEETG